MDASSSYHRIVGHLHICLILSLVGSHALAEELYTTGQNDAVSNQTATAYSVGVGMGIINPKKYSLQSFELHEKNIFKDTYGEYISLNGSHPMSYQDWLIMNNYGILSDTQESLLQKKISTRSFKMHKRRFVKALIKGDILITQKARTGLIGHVAMMATNHFVIEMPGGKGWMTGIRNNNRRISKGAWYEEYGVGWTTVYRCRNKQVAHKAGNWALRHYYNPKGGNTKTIRTTYLITFGFKLTNPSYCSKLVLQAFYNSGKRVINNVYKYGPVIVPVNIPYYFNKTPCNLMRVGKF